MSTQLGFIVLERNQAGGPLTVPDFADIARHRDEAEITKQQLADESFRAGRRDRYVIASVEVADDDRD